MPTVVSTGSHPLTVTKDGKQIRCYTSHRLAKDRCLKHPEARRLPAEQLESLIAVLIGKSLTRKHAVAELMKNAKAAKIADAQSQLQSLKSKSERIALVERIDIQPRRIGGSINRKQIADLFGVYADRTDLKGMQFEALFQIRRRGVKLRRHLGDAPPEIDRTLVQNVVNARRWMLMILDGTYFAEIASEESTSKQRVQDVVDFAMLASDILESVSRGEQRDELTSDYLIKTGVLAIWKEQHSEFAKL